MSGTRGVLIAVLVASALGLVAITASTSYSQVLEDDVCWYGSSSPGFFSITQSERRWAAVAVNPSGLDNKDIQLRWNFGQVQITVASSSFPSKTDFVIGDFNHNRRDEYIPYVYGGSPFADYTIQWDSGGEMTVGTAVSGSVAASAECGLIRVWDLRLLAGRKYQFTLTTQGSSDLRLALFKNPGNTSYWAGRQAGEFETVANSIPYVYTASGVDDDYGIVVYEANAGMAPGSFTLVVDDVTPCAGVLEAECYTYAGEVPQCYKIPPGSNTWIGFAVAPAPGDTKEICVHTGSNGSGSQLACSSAGGTNFVVADYNTGQPGWLFPRVTGGDPNATYVAQWEAGTETMVVGEPLVGSLAGGTSGDCGLFQVYDLDLEAGQSYHFVMEGGPAVRVALFRNPSQGVHWSDRAGAQFEMGRGEWVYTAETSGDHAVVIFTEDLSTSNQPFIVVVVPRTPLAEDACVQGATMPAAYEISQTRNHWAAFAVKASVFTEAAVLLSGVPSIFPINAHAGTQMQHSGFVVGDFNHNQTGEYFGIVAAPPQPFVHAVDWDPGDVLELGVPVQASLGQTGNECNLIRMFDVALEESRCYRVTLSASGNIAARVALFENPTAGAFWAADQEALIDLVAAQTPHVFTAGRSDVFGVAVYDKSFAPADGDFTLEIVQLDADCTTYVELSSFDISSTAASIALRWQSGVEADHLGFRLSRAVAATAGGASGDTRFEPIGPELIRSSGDRHGYAYTDDDPTLQPGVTYLYRLEAVDRHGDVQVFGPYRASLLAESPPAAGVTLLGAPQPNPFVRRTQLGYTLADPGTVELTIYDVGGRVVRALDQGFRAAGQHHAAWDGRDDHGTRLPSGVYFARLVTGSDAQAVRLLLVH
jgi:hypothetical protein